ncbi:hypothetical protein [Nonomuraea sp. NPDC002799]
MTDDIACPQCEGRRGELLGKLFLACTFCGGLGWVGGDNEPARHQAKPPPQSAVNHPVWNDPWIAAMIDCRYCLGSRRMAHIDEDAGTLITAPCPCADDKPSNNKGPGAPPRV